MNDQGGVRGAGQYTGAMHVRLAKSFQFEAAHFLPTFPDGHKCRRMHGHSFRVEIIVEGEIDSAKGYLIDYGEITGVVGPIREMLDHRLLNDLDGLTNPTSEILAGWIWARLEDQLPHLVEVVVHETCTSRCHYQGPLR